MRWRLSIKSSVYYIWSFGINIFPLYKLLGCPMVYHRAKVHALWGIELFLISISKATPFRRSPVPNVTTQFG